MPGPGTFLCRISLAGGALLALLALSVPACAQTAAASPSGKQAPKTSAPVSAANSTAAALDRLTRDNADLLDLLKKQQAVLEDIQYDRRLQARQISSLEDRLQDAMMENSQLEGKVGKLEEQVSLGASARSAPAEATPAKNAAPPAKLVDAPPPPPASYLPAPESEGAPGTKSWHRLFTLSGDSTKTSGLFHIQGVQWRVLWHNQDPPGAAYANTSALFISAFPKDDTIPQKVCSKLGSGGGSTEITGAGDYYLKVEASGGSWELAVEDFR